MGINRKNTITYSIEKLKKLRDYKHCTSLETILDYVDSCKILKRENDLDPEELWERRES